MSFFYEILNDGTPYRRKKLRVKRLILTIAAALFILITLLCSFAIIPSGYTGVRTTFGQIDTVAVSNGFIAKIPYVQSIKRVNNKQQEVSYADQIWGESSERTVVYAAGVTVTYRISPDYSAWIYANVSDYKQNALPQTLLSSAIKAAMVSLPSDEVTNRAKIEPIARQQLQTAIDQKYGGNPVISIVAVNIDDMDFEESYNQAIAEKQIAQMVFEKQKIQNETAVSAAEAKAKEQLIAAELRELSVYETILYYIASGYDKLNELHLKTGYSRAKISVYMKNLGTFHIVEKETSFETGGWENTKKGVYRIKDNYVNFWFRFVYPHLSELYMMSPEQFYDAYITSGIDEYLERYFKEVCMEYVGLLNLIGKLPMKISKMGTWIGKEGNIDIIAQNSVRENIVGYCNWNQPEFTMEMKEELLKSMKQAKIDAKYFFLFSAKGFSEEIRQLAEEDTRYILVDMNEL